MKTTDIKGKAYVEVNERLKYFRANFKGYSLRSELVSNIDGVVIFKASIFNAEQVEVANGYAYEKEGSSFINKTSYIENCETSAWGRCLGNFGIGIDTSVASADEVGNAIANQTTNAGTDKVKSAYANQNEKFKAELKKANVDVDDFYKVFNIKEENFMNIIENKEKLVEGYCFLKDNMIKDVRLFIKTTKVLLTKVTEKQLVDKMADYIEMGMNNV